MEIYGSNGALLYDQRKPCELELCIGREMGELFGLRGGVERKMKVQEVVDAVWMSAPERRWVDLPLPG